MMIAKFSQLAVVGVLLMILGLSQSAKLRGQGRPEQEAADAMEKEMRYLQQCNLAVSVTCTVGDGVECRSFQATPDRCLYENTYTYKFENKGAATLDITEAMSQVPGGSPTNLISFVMPKQLQPGTSTTVIQTQRVSYCQTDYVTATVMAKANPGQCKAQVSHTF